jgi:hypothetical protein
VVYFSLFLDRLAEASSFFRSEVTSVIANYRDIKKQVSDVHFVFSSAIFRVSRAQARLGIRRSRFRIGIREGSGYLLHTRRTHPTNFTRDLTILPPDDFFEANNELLASACSMRGTSSAAAGVAFVALPFGLCPARWHEQSCCMILHAVLATG